MKVGEKRATAWTGRALSCVLAVAVIMAVVMPIAKYEGEGEALAQRSRIEHRAPAPDELNGEGARSDEPEEGRGPQGGRSGQGAGKQDSPGKGHGKRGPRPCEHPWPCADGSEWPPGLEGPFAVGEMERVRIPVGEGQELEGVVVHPVLPEGVRAPVLLQATPYLGGATYTAPDSPRGALPIGDTLEDWGMRPFVEAGYAYAVVSVLGTGGSDGCFDGLGPRDQSSLGAAVEWLAARPWSNGRVGMTGYSWSGGTPFAAALADPPSLKTIVPAAVISNLYTFWTSPQGAWNEWPVQTVPPNWGSYAGAVTWTPPVQAAPEDAGTGWAQRLPGRLCPEARDFALEKYPSALTDERAPTFIEPRILTKRFPSIRTSVLVAHGLQDGGHEWQEEGVWEALANAPKRMLLGQWGHGYPVDANVHGSGLGDTWSAVALGWFDFWLKGLGEPPRLGVVDYEDNAGGWHSSRAWPPTEANDEALHFVGGSLQAGTGTGDGAASFVSTPAGGDFSFPSNCSPSIDTPPGLHFMSEPLPSGALLSGSPVVRLDVSSDQPGGVFSVALFSVPPGGDPCTDRWLYGTNAGVRWLSSGSVDLRFHAGNLTGQDFAPGRQVVRVDLSNLSHRVLPGERLGVWMGRTLFAAGQTSKHSTATITVHEASEIRLPLVEGTVAGSPPTGDLPPRPFQPRR